MLKRFFDVAFKDALAGHRVLNPDAPAVLCDRGRSREGVAALDRACRVGGHAGEHRRVARHVFYDPVLLCSYGRFPRPVLPE